MPRSTAEYRRKPLRVVLISCLALLVATLALYRGKLVEFQWHEWLLTFASDQYIIRHAKSDLRSSGDIYRSEWMRREVETEKMWDHLIDVSVGTSNSSARYYGTLANGLLRNEVKSKATDRLLTLALTPSKIEMRDSVRVGDPLIIRVTYPAIKTAIPWFWQTKVLAKLGAEHASAGNHPVIVADGGSYGVLSVFVPSEDWCSDSNSFGTRWVEISLEQNLDVSHTSNQAARSLVTHSGKTIFIRPRGDQIGEGILDASLSDAVGSCIRIRAYRVSREKVALMAWVTKAPCDIAFSVWIRADGNESQVGSLAVKFGESSSTQIGEGQFDTVRANRLSVILRSDSNVLSRTLDQKEFWEGQVRFLDVPVADDSTLQSDLTGGGPSQAMPFVSIPGLTLEPR